MAALPSAWMPGFAVVQQLGSRGVSYTSSGVVLASQLLPTDPIGTSTLTVQNMVSGSRWRLEIKTTGVLVAEGTATGADLPLTLSYYQPAQTMRLKVRKGTASPYYRPFDTEVTVGATSASVFVSQISDE